MKAIARVKTESSFLSGNSEGDSVQTPALSPKADQKQLRVFIADDSRRILANLIALLQQEKGVQIVGAARTTKAAIRAIQHLTPDLVILDFRLPDGNGLDVLKEIKQHDSCPLVMMLTNYAYPQYRERCRQWGADYFFDKSQDFEQVIRTCQQLLSWSERQPEGLTHASPQ
ncbi:MAG: response regulator [Acidobacteria bacterium]|nr:response regulator [Acidobacteriota bacterium]